ncbi:MAG: RnfABCDGE type electron transport complex subunit B [Anaerovoracaceae bacterium]
MPGWLIGIISVALLGLLLGVVLTVAAKLFKVKSNPLTDKVREELPGINCGACGYVGCDSYAEALTKQEGVEPNLCTPGGESVARKICEILDIPFSQMLAKHAVLRCAGSLDHTTYVMDWQSVNSCAANKTFYRGRSSCYQACLGYGDCVLACPFDAIQIVNGIAVVNRNRCTGCGICVDVCPNNLFMLTTGEDLVYVACSSHAKGKDTRKGCTTGCIACNRCVKACKFDAITINHNLAVIDQGKCTQCGDCIPVCPVKIIKRIGVPCDD